MKNTFILISMARALRIEYPGAFYHVFSRGVEKRDIFLDEQDSGYFLKLCSEVAQKLKMVVHCYCLMINHYHFYLETPKGNLSKIMHMLNLKYTTYFNKKYDRVGPLFQSRYRANLVDSNSYSLELSRYIHLNPVKAGLINDPNNWKLSSYPSYLSKAKAKPFLETNWLLSQFETVEYFKKFTMDGIELSSQIEKETREKAILGNKSFIEKIKRKHIPKEIDTNISNLRELRKDDNVTYIESAVKKLGLKFRLQKKLLIYALKTRTSLSLDEIKLKAGISNRNAVSQILSKIKQDSIAHCELKKYLGEIFETN